MKTVRIFNEFGIKPTTNHKAAGYDFYIPDIKTGFDESAHIIESFASSYKKSEAELREICDRLVLQVSAVHGPDYITGQEMNILLLYLMIDSPIKDEFEMDNTVEWFVDDYLIFDSNKRPGIRAHSLDQIFVNSGIHVALNPGTVGVFLNKSGKGIKGWDIRAQVIDEDYTGTVHLSLAYTKLDDNDGIIYCGDKITQMLIWNIENGDVTELSKDDYYNIMAGSERGASAFGSSDEKH